MEEETTTMRWKRDEINPEFIVRTLDWPRDALNGHKELRYHGEAYIEPYFVFLDKIIDACASPDERKIVGYVGSELLAPF
jgi:hypothetical protein